ncbi:MAG: hypothetical protein KJ593_07310 [Candidatus Omnitrophica bacterium]|nr:hypothetical protein [Candidatus Omnitrophota bacterium]
MKRRIFIDIVIAFVLIVFIGLVHFLAVAFAESPFSKTASNEKWSIYRDTQNRFEFSYPVSFGIPKNVDNVDMPGGDSGEAIFFPQFSYGLHKGKSVLWGTLVVRSGRTWVGAQALGGLYDPIAVGLFIDMFPVAIQERLRSQVENLTISNFCSELSKSEHISIDDSVLNNVTPEQKQVITGLDSNGNLNPKVIICNVLGDMIIFHKEAVFESGLVSSLRQIYGAIRFLKGHFSSVQFIRITRDPPDEELLETMAKIVQSFKVLH